MITAGSHEVEHAGVRGAVELIERLETDHSVYIIPSRDHVGLNGYEYALETVLGKAITIKRLTPSKRYSALEVTSRTTKTGYFSHS
jgi:hypothetical protein